jgi:lysozyme
VKCISDVRNYQVLDKHKGKALGVDVSEYQGKIIGLMLLENKYQFTSYSFATVGDDRLDSQFKNIG